jgi:hypothetical protein
MTVICLLPASSDVRAAADLAAIEREMPLVGAELKPLHAEIARLSAGRDETVLNRRRVRRPERRVLNVRRRLVNCDPKMAVPA